MRIGNILSTQRTGPFERATSRMTRLMLGLIAVIVFLGAVGNLQAQLHHREGNPQIPEAGRWHVQTLSGDQPAQVATGKPVSFDGAFKCASTACGGIQVFAHDSTICDPVDFENMSSGFDIDGITGAFQFGVSGGLGDFFVYTFVGTLSEVHSVTSGVTSLVSASITGTYGSTPGGCNNGLAVGQGTFIATWYPPMAGTFYGVLDEWSRNAVAATGQDRVAVPKRIFELCFNGATVILNQAHRALSSLSLTCRELALELGFPIQANVYIAPPASRGFKRHKDDHEILILPIAGSKVWHLYPAEGEVEIEVRAGDLLYLPRGLAHEAVSGSKPLILTWGKAYDRSPCGTGTSAKLACLAVDGKLEEGAEWIQESVIGSTFTARFRWSNRSKGEIIPTIAGRAHVTGESRLHIDPSDPFGWGIRA